MDRKPFFDAARVLAGGRLTQAQVDQLNKAADGLVTGLSMTTSQTGINLITSFEDLELKAYLCPAGVRTIGFGTTVYPDGTKVKKGDTCTVEQAKAYFAYDLKRFENAVNSALTIVVNQNQFDALVSLTYNIGETALKKSTLLAILNKGDLSGAAEQFAVWNKGRGKVLNGLVRRRAAERDLFLKK
ncbi:lysozyme [Acinetobacter sp. NIPH1876]|uniref:lysozyme n=1 Tax=Acinetobacter sp. NIPH1876 TaxID=2924041 RepID=UPI001FACD4A4|nr:lysozyme [Acinetobacter sp. NIPH1876]MCJ0830497.1 lysozyme [Acinetobacter sp. NIPH1876]